MIKYLILVAAIVGALVFLANRGTHVAILAEEDTNAILESIAAVGPEADVLRDFAPLPDYDRALIEIRCEPVYDYAQRLVGTKDSLHDSHEPGCQALMEGGWKPGWTIADGLQFLGRGG